MPRTRFSHLEGEPGQYPEDFGDAYGSCPPSPVGGVSSPTPEAFNHEVAAKELMQSSDMLILSQHLEEVRESRAPLVAMSFIYFSKKSYSAQMTLVVAGAPKGTIYLVLIRDQCFMLEIV